MRSILPSFTLIALTALLFFASLERVSAQTNVKTEVIPTVPHAGIIGSLAFDKEGNRLASGDWNGFVKVWDTRTRQLLKTFDKDLYGVNAVAFSPPGKEVAVGGKDYWAFKLVDAASGRVVQRFKGHEGEILSVAFSPDGTLLASGDQNNRTKVWDVASGKLLHDIAGHSSGVYSVAFTPDGKQILTASFDKSIGVWDAATGKSIQYLTGLPLWQYIKQLSGYGPDRDEDIFCSIVVSPDGSTAASGSWGRVRNVKLWDLRNGKLLRVFEGQSQSVQVVGFSPDGGRLFAAGDYGKIVMWNTATGDVVRSFDPQGHPILHAMAVSPKGDVLATGVGSRGFGPDLWSIESGSLLGGFGTDLRKGIDIAFTPDGSRLATGSDNGAAVWDTVAGRLIANFGDHKNEVSGIAISRDGKLVLTGGRDNLVKLWEVTSGRLLKTFAGHANWVERVSISWDGKRAASGDFIDGIIKIWDLESGKELRTLRQHRAYITALAFSSDGRSLVSGSWDGSVILWDLSTGRPRLDLKSQNRFVYNPKREDMEQARKAISWVGFSDNEENVLAVTHDGALSSWEARNGREIIQKPPVTSYVPSIILSHNGKYVVWDGAIESITMTDATTGKEVRGLPGLERGSGGRIVASADNRRVASMGNDRVVRVWDTQSGALLASLFNGGNEWVALTPQGFFNASSSKAGSMLSMVRGLETSSIGQIWQSLFAPDLVRESLEGDPDGEVKRAAEIADLDKVIESGPAPLVEITSYHMGSKTDRDLITVTARIADAGKGIGRIEWRVNGITTAVALAPADHPVNYALAQQLALDPGENTIELVAYNASNLLASLPARTTIQYTGAGGNVRSKLHVLAIGINAYRDQGWMPPGSTELLAFPPLNLAVSDAKALAAALEQAGAAQYAEVKVTEALDTDATALGLQQKIERMATEVKPRDTFVLFAAAHGTSHNGRFYLIPQDYDGGTNPAALQERAIGQDRLQDWLANRIKAKKVIVLLDTCESGALVGGYTRSRTDVPASEAAIGRLHEASGRPVLTAAAEGKPAFEGYEGHGVFTWALLDALKNGDRNGNGFIELSELVARVQDQVPKIATELNGRGRAAVAARGSTDDRQFARFGSRGEDFALVRRLQ